MKIPTIAQIMKRPCEFVRYQDNTLWYRVSWWNELRSGETYTAGVFENFDFPVPLDSHAAGVFEAEMKAVNLMRWIRKHIEFLTEARAVENDGG